MDRQKWLFGGEQAFTSTSCFDFGWKYGIISFLLEELTLPGDNDLTFGFKNDAMHCKICFQMNSRRHLSLCIAIGPALEMVCFLHSNAQGWHFAVHHSLKSSKLCNVCCRSLFMHFSSPSRDRFLLNLHKSSFSLRKTDYSHMTLSYLPPLGGLQIGFVGTPVAHQIVAGNSTSGT